VVDVFPVPNNPGSSAAVVAGMTAAVIAETTRLHKEATQVYRTYHNVDQAIKNLIIESFDDAYFNALSDEIVGYANCTSLQLLTHLLTYYAMMAPTERTQNYERLNALYDPARHHRRNRPIGNSNSFRSRDRIHIDYDQCQASHATRGCSSTDCATQGRDRGPKEQDQTCLARSTTYLDDEQ
jgi:hypothetical protein